MILYSFIYGNSEPRSVFFYNLLFNIPVLHIVKQIAFIPTPKYYNMFHICTVRHNYFLLSFKILRLKVLGFALVGIVNKWYNRLPQSFIICKFFFYFFQWLYFRLYNCNIHYKIHLTLHKISNNYTRKICMCP